MCNFMLEVNIEWCKISADSGRNISQFGVDNISIQSLQSAHILITSLSYSMFINIHNLKCFVILIIYYEVICKIRIG